jgi:Spy/CpxP family protein refolding chaperone
MEAPSFSEPQVRAAAQALAEVQADLTVQQARLRSDVYALLTPEQQQRLQEIQAEREAAQTERRERMQERRQGRTGR